MKKIILFFCILGPLTCFAQKDFDYTIYTTRAQFKSTYSTDSTMFDLLLLRKIQKESNIIKIISLVNTGDAISYAVLYTGCSMELKSFIYSSEDNCTIYINPVQATVTVVDNKRKTKAEYY